MSVTRETKWETSTHVIVARARVLRPEKQFEQEFLASLANSCIQRRACLRRGQILMRNEEAKLQADEARTATFSDWTRVGEVERLKNRGNNRTGPIDVTKKMLRTTNE